MSENSPIRRTLIGLLIASAVITLILVFLGTNRSDLPEPTFAALKTLDIHVVNRQVVGGVPTFRANQGDHVEIHWSSDETGEVHLHGYEVATELSDTEIVTVAFEATLTGRFPIKSHGFGEDREGDFHAVLAYVEILPR